MRHISRAAAKVIDGILSDGARVELIPTKNGVRVVRVRRDQAFETPETENVSNDHLQISKRVIQ